MTINTTTGRVTAVCGSETKGTRKLPCSHGVFQENFGMAGDAHAQTGIKRQVSLLAMESIEKMKHTGLVLNPGDFGENLTVEGIELFSLIPGTLLSVGDKVILEITQIGKQCHQGCAIFKQVGKCIMPREGVFARVIRGGTVHPGDEIVIRDQETHP